MTDEEFDAKLEVLFDEGCAGSTCTAGEVREHIATLRADLARVKEDHLTLHRASLAFCDHLSTKGDAGLSSTPQVRRNALGHAERLRRALADNGKDES